MSINWNEAACTTSSSAQIFGLCDDEDERKKTQAYISEDSEDLWLATVINSQTIGVNFTAIDNCVEILRPDKSMASRCDGILSYGSTIVFVELKDKKDRWAGGGFKQIEATVELYERDGNLAAFTTRKAYVSNRRKQLIPYNNLATQNKFDENWNMTIHAENIINIE